MESSMPPMATRGPAVGRPAWATAIGVIAIIFGILGMLGGCLGGVYMTASGPIADALEEQNIRGMEAQIAQMRSISRYAIPSAVSSVIALGLGAGLLAVGVGTMRQRGWARTAAVTWSYFISTQAVTGSSWPGTVPGG